MPFVEIDVDALLQKAFDADPEYKEYWEKTRTEYRILGELVKYRKQSGLSQSEIARKTGFKQQAISRMENKESSPSLKNFCLLTDALGLDIMLVPRNEAQNKA